MRIEILADADQVARRAAEFIAAEAHGVSMPSWDLFESQSEDYRNSVLPQDVRARVAIEQASTFGWERYVGREGHTIGMHTFGASAPLKAMQQEFGFTVENIVAAAKAQLPKK